MDKTSKGVLLILFSSLCFAIMNLFINMAGELPAMQKSFFRNCFALIYPILLLRKQHISFIPPKGTLKLLIMRSTAGAIGLICAFFAIDKMQLADYTILGKLAPFSTIFFSYLILKEKIGSIHIIAILTALIGTVFVVKPTMTTMISLPALLCLTDALLSGVAYTLIRKLGQKNVPSCYIVFFFTLFCTIVTFPLALLDFQVMTIKQLLLLILSALLGSMGQISMTAAYNAAPSKSISIFEYTQVIFAAILAFVFLSQLPDVYSFIGYCIISLAAFTLYLYNRKSA